MRPMRRPPGRVVSVIPEMPSLVTLSGIDAVSGGRTIGGDGGPPARAVSRTTCRDAAIAPVSKSRSDPIAVSVYGRGETFWMLNDPSGPASAWSMVMLCAPGVELTVFDDRFTIAPGDGPPDEFNTTPDIVAARRTALS